MIYLDSGATTLEKPPAVAQAMARAVGEMSSPGRGNYPASQRAAQTAFACREAAAELFGCRRRSRWFLPAMRPTG